MPSRERADRDSKHGRHHHEDGVTSAYIIGSGATRCGRFADATVAEHGDRGARCGARRCRPRHRPDRGDLLRQRPLGPADRAGVRARAGRPAPLALRRDPDGERRERVRERLVGAASRLHGDRRRPVRDRRGRRLGEDVAPRQAPLDRGARRCGRRRPARRRAGGSQRLHGQLRRARARPDRALRLESRPTSRAWSSRTAATRSTTRAPSFARR